MGFVEGLQRAALSMVVAGNEGIAPFLTLFLVGVIEKSNPDLLSMSSAMEMTVASWPGLIILGIMTALEFVAKCIPVVDEAVDSIMLFIVPFMSVLGTLSTFGLYGQSGEADATAAAEEDGRRLGVVSSGALILIQIVLICVGVVLSVSMHMFKMLVRLVGVGCFTGCITLVEVTFCVLSVTFAIYVKQIAIFVAAIMFVAAGYVVKRRWWDKRHEGESEGANTQNDGDFVGDYQATADAGEIGGSSVPAAKSTEWPNEKGESSSAPTATEKDKLAGV